MRITTFVLFITLTFFSCQTKKVQEPETEIIVIGTLHEPAPNFNSETLFNILEDLKPDFILQERDSSVFNSEFQFIETQTENEGKASSEYIKKYPTAQLRPYEFENRNQYRIEKGMRPADKLSLQLIDSLHKADLLAPTEAKIFKAYQDALEPLKVIASQSPDAWNNPSTDSLCKNRQYYQYQMIPKITNTREEFANRFITIPSGEQVSYREGYQLWANFWDLRNQTMAKNIMRIADQNKGKKIIVLCGFMHRYYILEELERLTKNKAISIKEFYDN